MTQFDCFNGDADGICALTQLRLAEPCDSTLITGVKRDIQLLDRVNPSAGDRVVALDVSYDKNRTGVQRALEAGASVFYCDHHFAGELAEHPQLQTIINTAPDVCTSLLINQYLDGAYLEWAVVGTFGDNLERSALGLAKRLNYSEAQVRSLKNLGIYINYNGYGAALEDLYFDPADLFKRTSLFASALGFIQEDQDTFSTLENGYHEDMAKANQAQPVFENAQVAVYQLPNESWARRVSGVFGNDLANQHPAKAHAVLTEKQDGDYVVSVRAPLNNKQGADEVCRQFNTGGGRAAAAGINALSPSSLEEFQKVFAQHYA